MSLKFVFGGSGAGKSTYVFKELLHASMQNPDKQYFVMVPDQFTMSTQKRLCNMHERGGIMNIDVQSFSRLTHRISDELGSRPKILLDDTGKNLILRDVALKAEDRLTFLGAKLRRPGYIHEVKSMISEFYQYAISPEDLSEMIEKAQGRGNLPNKLQDLKILYEEFRRYLGDHYITSEEALEQLCGMIEKSELLRGSEIVFDGFTGFTPIQYHVIHALLRTADRVTFTLCADGRENILYQANEQALFALSQQTYSSLCRFADQEKIEIEEPVYLDQKPVRRLADAAELAFLEANLFRNNGKHYEDAAQMIGLHEADTLVSEVQNVCLSIRRLIRREGYAYRDFAVVTGDLSRYAHIVRREFERYQIPYFMDQNRGIRYQPMAEYLKAALGIIKYNFSYDSVMTFLRSGMSDVRREDADRLALYIRQYGIRGRKQYESRFTRGEEQQEENRIREQLLEELAPVMTRLETAQDYVKALYALCERGHLQKKCIDSAKRFEKQGDLSAAKEYEKIYGACMQLFDQIYELIGEQEMTTDEFMEIFEAGISEIQIGTIPQTVDQVVVGDIERSRLGEIKVLFFIGVNDGVIPGKGDSGGILSEMEREFFRQIGIEMAPTPRERIFQQRLYLYQNMTRPTHRLCLSYSKMTGEAKTAQPSYLIRVLCGLFPKLVVSNDAGLYAGDPLSQIESATDGLDDMAKLLCAYVNGETAAGSGEEETLWDALVAGGMAYRGEKSCERLLEAAGIRYEPDALSEAVAALLYENKKKGSVSRLERFAACAYAHFLQYGIGIAERKEYEFDRMDFGIVYHSVINELLRHLQKEGKGLTDLSEQQISEQIGLLMDQTALHYKDVILYDSGRNEFLLQQMKRLLTQSVISMRYQLAKGNFKVAYSEKDFQFDGDVDLQGKIDRVDLCRAGESAYVRVVDYKSSHKEFDMSEMYYGLSLQLPIYLHAATKLFEKADGQENVTSASMLYFSLANPILKEQDSKEGESDQTQLYKSMRMDGLTVGTQDVIANTDRDFKDNTDYKRESDVIKLALKGENAYKAGSQIISGEDMDRLLNYAWEKAQLLTKEMLRGEISIDPKQLAWKDKNSCEYCAYRQICRFDDQIPGYKMKELPKMTEEGIQFALERKEAGDDAVDA